MNKNTVVVVLVLIVVVAGGVWLFQGSSNESIVSLSPSVSISTSVSPSPTPTSSASPATSAPSVSAVGITITYTDEGYSPSTVTVKAGTKVTFKNNSTKDMWPASAMHPTHKVYPGSGIEKCDTAEESKIFDACRGIKPGQSYSFTFTEKGAWGFHDHLNSGEFGRITVE